MSSVYIYIWILIQEILHKTLIRRIIATMEYRNYDETFNGKVCQLHIYTYIYVQCAIYQNFTHWLSTSEWVHTIECSHIPRQITHWIGVQRVCFFFSFFSFKLIRFVRFNQCIHADRHGIYNNFFRVNIWMVWQISNLSKKMWRA